MKSLSDRSLPGPRPGAMPSDRADLYVINGIEQAFRRPGGSGPFDPSCDRDRRRGRRADLPVRAPAAAGTSNGERTVICPVRLPSGRPTASWRMSRSTLSSASTDAVEAVTVSDEDRFRRWWPGGRLCRGGQAGRSSDVGKSVRRQRRGRVAFRDALRHVEHSPAQDG